MQRRYFIAGLAGAVAIWPRAVRSAEPVRHIIALFPLGTDDPEQMVQRVTLRLALENIGWTDGRKAHIEYRHANDTGDFARLAKEAVAQKPDLIFAASTGLVAAVARETRTIPVVFANASDPIGAGFAASLAHPGGNMTGLLLFETSVIGKWLSMLKEISPRLKRAALLGNANTTAYDYFLRSAQAAAQKLVLEVVPVRIEGVEDIERTIESFASAGDGGLVIAPDSTMLRNRASIIAVAARLRLPAVYPERLYAVDGGLMSYGVADTNEPFRQAAVYIDRILNGANPGNLPVQAPTKYSLLVNRGTAKALGLAVPPTLLARADEVIE
jgi:putative ABC transport system substrate-binding protein